MSSRLKKRNVLIFENYNIDLNVQFDFSGFLKNSTLNKQANVNVEINKFLIKFLISA
mgnify:CR=1 FL=1